MPGFRSYFVVIAAGACALAAQHLPASSHGPMPGHTGGFGEPTCRACHFDYDLNEGPVTLRLDSLPDAYAPQQSYRVHLFLRHPELERGGFQLTARFEDGSAAGQFEIPDTALLRVQSQKGIAYLSHTGAGTNLVEGDSVAWAFEWKAPASDRPVVFHVAANVSNHDASEFGDRIFTGVFYSGGERVKK